MITANELRIGNCFKRPTGDVVRVEEIRENGFNYTSGWHAFADGKYLQKITIDKELLPKIGFDLLDDFNYNVARKVDKKIRQSLTLHLIKDSWMFINGHEHLCTGRTITYLHELQNLWYAVTGSELKIKL